MNVNQKFLDFEKEFISLLSRYEILQAELNLSKKAFEMMGEPTVVQGKPYDFMIKQGDLTIKIRPLLPPRVNQTFKLRDIDGYHDVPLKDD